MASNHQYLSKHRLSAGETNQSQPRPEANDPTQLNISSVSYALTPQNILGLQRSIGNQAVQRLLSKQQVTTASTSYTLTPQDVLGLQRSIGNRAVQRLLNKQRANIAPQVQRTRPDQKDHSDNNQKFLKSHMKKVGGYQDTDVNHRSLAVIAWLLDQNHYTLQQLRRQERQLLPEETKGLNVWNLNQQDLAKFIFVSHDQLMNLFMNNVPILRGGAKISRVDFAPLTPWGASTGMKAKLEKESLPLGSKAGGDPEWMLQLEQRIGHTGSTIYVRGHLLNSELGGPGLDYNMVPLTGKPKLNGTNDANKEHLDKVETKVKELDDEVQAGNIQDLEYTVTPVYNRSARAGTTTVVKAVQDFKNFLNTQAQLLENQLDKLSDQDVDKELDKIYLQIGMTPHPSVQVQMDIKYKRAFLKDHAKKNNILNRKFGTVPNLEQDLQKAGIPIEVLKASVPKKQSLANLTIDQIVYYAQENALLWQQEDIKVPQQLDTCVTWTGNAQGKTSPIVEPIPIDLPTDIDATFDPRLPK